MILKPTICDWFESKRQSVAFFVFKPRHYFFISVIVIWKSVEDGVITVYTDCGLDC